MTMTKIEEVARAISLAQCQTDRLWDAFMPEARAAIEAMRVPSDRMVANGGGVRDWSSDVIWENMIDAALSEQQP